MSHKEVWASWLQYTANKTLGIMWASQTYRTTCGLLDILIIKPGQTYLEICGFHCIVMYQMTVWYQWKNTNALSLKGPWSLRTCPDIKMWSLWSPTNLLRNRIECIDLGIWTITWHISHRPELCWYFAETESPSSFILKAKFSHWKPVHVPGDEVPSWPFSLCALAGINYRHCRFLW